MSLLAVDAHKTRKISRRIVPSAQRLRNKILILKKRKLFTESFVKCEQNSESQTKIQGEYPEPDMSPKNPINLNCFQSYNPYTLGSINSIFLSNGRIYDLLLIKNHKSRQNKLIKCRCSKSKCSVKYCDCFANGEACGTSCQCRDCLNIVNDGSFFKKSQERICRCTKSQCMKKYCQCFQRGDSCSSKCRCLNCKNISGEAINTQF